MKAKRSRHILDSLKSDQLGVPLRRELELSDCTIEQRQRQEMVLKTIFLLFLQVQVIHVSSFATKNPRRQISNVKKLYSHRKPPDFQPHRFEAEFSTRQFRWRPRSFSLYSASTSGESPEDSNYDKSESSSTRASTYDLGVGKNPPVGSSAKNDDRDNNGEENIYWNVPELPNSKKANDNLTKSIAETYTKSTPPRRVRRMVARTEESSTLRGAIWHEEHYSIDGSREQEESSPPSTSSASASPSLSAENVTGIPERWDNPSLPTNQEEQMGSVKRPEFFYPNIDLSIPLSIYDPENSKDIVWDLMRWEAYQEAQREPLLVSFLYSSILNHDSLESSLAFLLANKLSSAAMISTQVGVSFPFDTSARLIETMSNFDETS